LSAIGDGMLNEGWWPVLWFFAKVVLMVFIFIWLRGTLPRLRYDQFMQFGWKVLLPVSLVWIVAIAGMRLAFNEGIQRQQMFIGIAVFFVILMVILFLIPERKEPEAEEEPAEFDAFAGGFPVPPLPGQEAAPTHHPRMEGEETRA